MKDTYIGPNVGLKYTHEKILDKYNNTVLSARQDRYKQILENIKDRTKPMDHSNIKKHNLHYSSLKVKLGEERSEEVKSRVAPAQHSCRNR